MSTDHVQFQYLMPRRIQRKRTKGWRMPDGVVYVGRPTRWGNPWSVAAYYEAGYSGSTDDAVAACVEMYRAWMTRSRSSWSGDVSDEHVKLGKAVVVPPDISTLRGRDLACWCPLDQPCHADVLLELANA
jgi:hypothetical protein